MLNTVYRIMRSLLLILLLAASLNMSQANAQDDIQPLRVNAAAAGKITSGNPLATYSFNAVESLRMAVVFDVIEGDMHPSLVVMDQDQTTPLATAEGPNINGLIVEFPSQGTYYVRIQGDSGTKAVYRLMIEAAPALPIDAFVAQTFMVEGESTVCTENTIVGRFTSSGDLNVCFSLELIEQPMEFEAQWWTPSGQITVVETATMNSSDNGNLYLTGIVHEGTPWETGWWQVHFLLDGELAKIQWVLVTR